MRSLLSISSPCSSNAPCINRTITIHTAVAVAARRENLLLCPRERRINFPRSRPRNELRAELLHPERARVSFFFCARCALPRFKFRREKGKRARARKRKRGRFIAAKSCRPVANLRYYGVYFNGE